MLAPGARIAARKPKAQIYRIRTITSGCIAYAAIIVCHPVFTPGQY